MFMFDVYPKIKIVSLSKTKNYDFQAIIKILLLTTIDIKEFLFILTSFQAQKFNFFNYIIKEFLS